MIILHLDNRPYFPDLVGQRIKQLSWAGRREDVAFLARFSPEKARAVILGEDQMMKRLRPGGHPDAVILDLMVGVEDFNEIGNWIRLVRTLEGTLLASPPDQWMHLPPDQIESHIGDDVIARLAQAYPSVAVGRLARKYGCKVVILSNFDERFLPKGDLDRATQEKLVMAACGASAYVEKTDNDWQAKLTKALEDC